MMSAKMLPVREGLSRASIHAGHVDEGGELDTLSSLYEYCKHASTDENERVVYMHNKGSLHPSETNTNWRRAMTDAVTHELCLDPPDTKCNFCGLQVAAHPRMFALLMPGNFFAAKCSYVNKLLHPRNEYSERMRLIRRVFQKGRLTVQLFGSKNLVTGKGRYTPEHWIGSHPQLSPCDLSVEEDYWHWQSRAHSQDEFQFCHGTSPSVFNTSKHFERTVVRENPDLRLREYTLLPGLLHRFITL
jgi:hypothetical protein